MDKAVNQQHSGLSATQNANSLHQSGCSQELLWKNSKSHYCCPTVDRNCFDSPVSQQQTNRFSLLILLIFTLLCITLISCTPSNRELYAIKHGHRTPEITSKYDVRPLTATEILNADPASLTDEILVSTLTQHILNDKLYSTSSILPVEEEIRRRKLMDLNMVDALKKNFFAIEMPASAAATLIRERAMYYGPMVTHRDDSRLAEKWKVAHWVGVHFYLYFINGRLKTVSRTFNDPEVGGKLHTALTNDKSANAFLWGYDWTSDQWHPGRDYSDRVGKC